MNDLVQTIVGALGTIIVVATPIVVAFVVQYLRKKLRQAGLEATDLEMGTLRRLATEGIAFAAQRANVSLKTGVKLSGEEKKALALGFAKKLANKYGVDPSTLEVLDDMVEAVLAGGEPTSVAATTPADSTIP